MDSNKRMIETVLQSTAVRISIMRDEKEVGHAYLFLITNDLHDVPYGLLEDVFVDDAYRGQGIGTELVESVITSAKKHDCYKLVATCRNSKPHVHAMYEKIGFDKYGAAFRMDFE